MAKGGGQQQGAASSAPTYLYNFLENGKWNQRALPGEVYRYGTAGDVASKFSDEIVGDKGTGAALIPVTGRDYSTFNEGDVYNLGGVDYTYKDGGFRRGQRVRINSSASPEFQFLTEEELGGVQPGGLFKTQRDGADAYFTYKDGAFDPYTFQQNRGDHNFTDAAALPGQRTLGKFSDVIVSGLSTGGGQVRGAPVAPPPNQGAGGRPLPTISQPLSRISTYSLASAFNRARPAASAAGPTASSSWANQIALPGETRFDYSGGFAGY